MAGESPDRSEREKSSGETAEDTGRVPSAPSEPEPGDAGVGGDERLRAAVAAWVAGDEGDEGAQEAEESAATTSTEDGGERPAASDLPVRRPARPADDEPADEPAEAGDPPTTMFGAVRREPAEERGTTGAARRAERMTSAFFGAARRHEEDADDQADDADDEGTPPAPSERPGGTPPADDAPAAEPAEPPSAATADAPGVTADTAEPAEGRKGVTVDAAEPAEGRKGGTPAASAPAAPAAPAASDARDDTAPEDADGDAGDGAEQEGRDRDTAMLRAPRDRPATAIRLPDADAGSRFVPLRSPDDETPGALPPERPRSADGPRDGGAALSGTERTKQQPVPDPEPLDLLAQLTNTPPPPETPLRTAARRVKIWTPLVVLLGIVFVVAQSVRPLPQPEFALTAAQSYTFDGSKPSLPWPAEGQAYVEVSGLGVLGRHGKPKPVPIGSVAKTMTAYLVLRKHPLKKGEDGPMITVDAKAEEGGTHGHGNGGESVLDTVHAGDRISERDALSALMIPSANNIARLLARWYTGGSEARFVQEMNEAADALGMDDTTYTDPSGLKESTVSTAADQVKLGEKVVEMPELVSITSKPSWTDPSGKSWRNWNNLVPFDGAIGIKTGTTTAAGGNLLFAGTKEVAGTTQVIVGAVLGQHKPSIIDTVTAVSKALLIAAGDTLQAQRIVRKGQVVGYVDDRLGGRTPVVATKDVTAVGWAGLQVPLGLEEGKDPVPHTARADEVVGVLTVGEGPGQVRVPVALAEDLREPGFADKLTRVL